MKSHMLTEASRSDKSPQRIGYIPICRNCGKLMKLEWSDSVTGNKQFWCCEVCFHSRIVNLSFTIGRGAL